MSDFHGKSPVQLVERLQNSGVERAVFLGDYDNPQILKEILKLEIDKIVLIGNHDYEFASGDEVYSQLLEMPSHKYPLWWRDCPDEQRFVLGCYKIRQGRKKGIKVVRGSDNGKIVYVHGALVSKGGFSTPHEVWARMILDKSKIANFKEMQRKNYWVLFHGHDHERKVLTLDKGESAENFQDLNWRNFKLDAGKRYIIGIGGFWFGDYALFDDETLNLEFRNYYERD